MDYLITVALFQPILKLLVKFPFFKCVPIPSYAWSRKEKEDNSGTGYEDGQYPFVLYNCAVLRHKTHFRLLVDYNNGLNDPIVRSLVIKTGRVFFKNNFIVGVKSPGLCYDFVLYIYIYIL